MPRRSTILALLLCGVLTTVFAGDARGSEPALGPVTVLAPTGPPRGSVLALAGGGWNRVGPGALGRVLPRAELFRSWGYEVWSPSYGPRERSVADVLAAYDALEATSDGRPTCVYGRSAGGHLALVTAAMRPSVDGVISAAGPTDLPALPPGPRHSAALAFGADMLERLSPVAFAGALTQPLLLEYGRADPLVPPAQGRALAGVAPSATLVNVPALLGGAGRGAGRSTVSWVHGSLWRAAAHRLIGQERAWLAAHCSDG